MEKHSNDSSPGSPELLGAGWFDPIEAAIRDRVRGSSRSLLMRSWTRHLGVALSSLGIGRSGWRSSRISAWTTEPPVAWFIWPGDDQRATRTTEQHGRGEPGMAQRGAATLCEDDEAGRGDDRGRLFVGHQHAPGSVCTRRAVQGGGRQGCCQPNLAEGADGLGGVVPALAG